MGHTLLRSGLTQLQMHPLASKPLTFHSSTLLHRFSPQSVVKPTTESEIIQILQAAAAQEQKVRAIGAMHSYAPIFSTAGVCIVLTRYNRLVELTGNLITVQAGMTLAELNEILAKHHLALPIVGAIDQQTVSGAIATATHGGSLHHPSMSSYVKRLRLVRANGSVLEIDSSEEIFQAVGVSMGLLGLISTVTFQCVPTFTLQARSQSMTMDKLLAQFEKLHQNNRYLDIKYLPIIDSAQVLTINPSAENIAPDVAALLCKSALERKIKTFVLKGLLFLFQYRYFNWLQRWLVSRHENKIYAPYQTNRSDRVMTHLDQTYYDPIPLSNMEIAVPFDQAPAALQVLRNYFQQTRRYPNIFIRIRCSAADTFWLSPAYQRPTCWLDFCEYPYTGKFFRTVVELLRPFNIRCHWGKEIQLERTYLRQRYEKWDEFLRLRQAWDPQQMFSNERLDAFFATGIAFDAKDKSSLLTVDCF
ncbi:MAG: D-arabinono-1,4-lactone oxidase [Cyanobacteria bacterium J06635_1]